MNSAIVGCGNIASTHAKCIQTVAEHKLIAFADSKLEKAQAFAAQYGGRAYPSLEALLDHEKIDVIHICTPHYLHVPMAIYCLQKGVHVFMEKPPVISREQLNMLKDVKTDRYLGFCFQNRYNPSIVKVKEMLQSGVAGRILGARGYVTWSRSKEYYTSSDWRGNLEYEGGGALINQSIHTMDLLQYLIDDRPISIDAMITNHHLKGIIDVEDTISAYIEYPDSIACFYATTSYVTDASPIIELCCENMIIRIEDLKVTCYYKNGQVEKIPITGKKGYGKSYWGAGHEDCISDFYKSIEENRPFFLNLEEIEMTLELMLGAYESGRSGKEIFFS